MFLYDLTPDALLDILAFLPPPDLVTLRKTCRLFFQITQQRIVWTTACKTHVIANGYPFPTADLADLTLPQLVYHTLHAFALGLRWRKGIQAPCRVKFIEGTAGASVSSIRFLAGHDRRFVMVISKSIWSVLSIWDLGTRRDGTEDADPVEICSWSPRGAIFGAFAVNTDGDSEAEMVISLQIGGSQQVVKLLSLSRTDAGKHTLVEIGSLDSSMDPVALSGDLVALSNDQTQTVIWNWKLGTCGYLEHAHNDDEHVVGHDQCLRVAFLHESILVVRARSVNLFPYPAFVRPSDSAPPLPHPPLARHSFGWIDGVSVTTCPNLIGAQTRPWDTVFILVRGESDDPWHSNRHNLELYAFDPNALYTPPTDPDTIDHQVNTLPSPLLYALSLSVNPIHLPNPFRHNVLHHATVTPLTEHGPRIPPYTFPPRLHAKVASRRGALRCTQIVLGRLGSAVWVEPQDRFAFGLIAEEEMGSAGPGPARRIHERLLAVAFRGPLSRGEAVRPAMGGNRAEGDDEEGGRATMAPVDVPARPVYENVLNNWTALDYDEDLGRVAFGTGFGRVTILQL